MWPESQERKTKLKTGLTTGSCATACSLAAAHYLLGGRPIDTVSVTLPKGQMVDMTIYQQKLCNDGAIASTIKNAGDDPDVTHGAEVSVCIRKTTVPGIDFVAGEGVGIVTREGLSLAVGEPAINPVPRKMISAHLQQVAGQYQYKAGFQVIISIKNGKDLAMKTMNPRLGIEGGLSILGTSGIVRPFSCSAYIASIHQAVDVAKANGINALIGITGNSSEAYIKRTYDVNTMALIEMGDFIGALLKYIRRHPVKLLTICGGFGKISKLAKGHMDLHSRVSSIDFEFLANLAEQQGAQADLAANIVKANTSIEALKLCQQASIPLANDICQYAHAVVKQVLRHDIPVNILVIDRQGQLAGQYGEEPLL